MALLVVLAAAGAAIYWSACTWPAVSTDILSFLFYWALLPHAVLYMLISLLHPTVWYTKRSAAAFRGATAEKTRGAGEEEEEEEVAAAPATEAAAVHHHHNLRSGGAVSKQTQRANSAESTPSTRAGYSAAATPSTTPPPSCSLPAPSSPATAAVASPAAPLALSEEEHEASVGLSQKKRACVTSSVCLSTTPPATTPAAVAPTPAAAAASAAAAAPAAERQLPLTTRILSFVVTRILCLLLLTCLYINLFCLLHLHRVWYWYVPYACWCIFLAETYGRPTGFSFQTVRRSWCWKYLGEYFPLVLLKENAKASYPADTNYLFGFHPHGILSLSYTGQFGGDSGRPDNDISRLLPGLTFRLTTLELNMRLPFLRHVMQALGFVACSKENLLAILGRCGCIVRLLLVLSPDMVCCALAARPAAPAAGDLHAAALLQVYSLGENDVFNVIDSESPFPKALSETTMKVFGFAVPLFFGRGVLQLFMPLRVPVYTMIGEPLRCPRIQNPSDEDIDKLRRRYAEELQRLYNQLKEVYRPKRTFEDLRFVD